MRAPGILELCIVRDVYHGYILQHEDNSMMALGRVL
jgi:hypothetical protein